MKKFVQFAVMGLATTATALTFAAGANAATDEEAPSTQNVWRTSDRGVVNAYPGSVTETEVREGSQAARVTDSFVAGLPQEVSCMPSWGDDGEASQCANSAFDKD